MKRYRKQEKEEGSSLVRRVFMINQRKDLLLKTIRKFEKP